MNKIYYVTIKGRTLESRDLKHLLARAVAEKRNMDRKSDRPRAFQQQIAMDMGGNCYGDACQSAAI